MLANTQSIACAFGLAAAAPRSPYRHLELCGVALKWRGEQPEWYGDLWQESGYLFTNEYGGPMNPDNITQYLNRMGDRLQKENPNFPHLNPHAFRHAVASILVANGTDIVTTAAFIGDKPATVSERYAHIIDSAKIRAGDTLSSVIFGDGNK